MKPNRNVRSEAPRRPLGADQLDMTIALLTLQAAFGLLSVLGTIVFGAAAGSVPSLAGAIVLGLIGPVAALALAAGIGQRRRWARNGVLLFEGMIVLGEIARLVLWRGAAVQLVSLLTSGVLPAVVLGFVLSAPARRAFARKRSKDPSVVRRAIPANVEQAA